MKAIILNGRVFSVCTNTSPGSCPIPGGIMVDVPDGALVELGQPWDVSLDAAKVSRIAEATALCDSILAPFGREYGKWETATFDQQYAEATAYQASPAAPVPLLASMCVARGISIADLAGRIVANRAAWVALTGNVIGQRQRITDRIDACQTVAEMMAVDVTITLP